jgi:hypothetical protein
MSDHDSSTPKPLILRVEISAEQASTLAPLFEGRTIAPEPSGEDYADASTGALTDREEELLRREAEFEADVQFREDRIERWRTELEELEQTLDRRERDLSSYVDQLQGAMASSSDAWWSRPVGGDGGVR